MGIERKDLEHLLDLPDQELAQRVDRNLNEEGKRIAIELYRIGFTALNPNIANYYIPGFSAKYTYALNLAETQEEAAALLEEGTEILNKYGIQIHDQSIEAPEGTAKYFKIQIVINFDDLRDYTPKKTISTETNGFEEALKQTLGSED